MLFFNEHSLEMATMELFEQKGNSHQSGETIHKELSDVLLREDLRMFSIFRTFAVETKSLALKP